MSDKNRKRKIQLERAAAGVETKVNSPGEQRKLQETLRQKAAAEIDAAYRASKEARTQEILAACGGKLPPRAESAPVVAKSYEELGQSLLEAAAKVAVEAAQEPTEVAPAPAPAAAPPQETKKQRKARQAAERAAQAAVDGEQAPAEAPEDAESEEKDS